MTDLIIRTNAVDLLDQTVRTLPMVNASVVDGTWDPEARTCHVRVLGDIGFFRFAMERQGYGEIVGEVGEGQMSTDTPDLPPRVQAADRRRGFRLLLSESSVDPAYDPYGVLADAPQEVTVRTCETVGELIRENFLYLLDQGEHDTLRRLMDEAADWLDELPLPAEEVPGV